MSYHDWMSIWYSPTEDDIIAFISLERIAEIGGVDLSNTPNGIDAHQINYGMSVIQRWCRLHCSSVPTPVNVKGKSGFAFKNQTDAVLFKLTWGG